MASTARCHHHAVKRRRDENHLAYGRNHAPTIRPAVMSETHVFSRGTARELELALNYGRDGPELALQRLHIK